MVLTIQSPTSGVLLLIFSVQKLKFFFPETQDENQYPILLYLKLGSQSPARPLGCGLWKSLSRRAEAGPGASQLALVTHLIWLEEVDSSKLAENLQVTAAQSLSEPSLASAPSGHFSP